MVSVELSKEFSSLEVCLHVQYLLKEYVSIASLCRVFLKSLGPIDRKFHGHGENDGFVLY